MRSTRPASVTSGRLASRNTPARGCRSRGRARPSRGLPPEYVPRRETQRARSRSPTRPGSTLFTATPPRPSRRTPPARGGCPRSSSTSRPAASRRPRYRPPPPRAERAGRPAVCARRRSGRPHGSRGRGDRGRRNADRRDRKRAAASAARRVGQKRPDGRVGNDGHGRRIAEPCRGQRQRSRRTLAVRPDGSRAAAPIIHARRGSVHPGPVCGDRSRRATGWRRTPADVDRRRHRSGRDAEARAAGRRRQPTLQASAGSARARVEPVPDPARLPRRDPAAHRLRPALVVGDTWLTLMAGREVVDHGLPKTETLTILGAGATWTDQQWLAQVVVYGATSSRGCERSCCSTSCSSSPRSPSRRRPRERAAPRRARRSSSACSRSSPARGAGRCAQTTALPLFAGVLWLLIDAPARRSAADAARPPAARRVGEPPRLGRPRAVLTMLLAVYELVRARRLAWLPARARRPRAALRPRDAVRVGRSSRTTT